MLRLTSATTTFLLLMLLVPASASAQRQLHWNRVDVQATLDANGTLNIIETQTMVFSGDWNGGERRFNIRPRQTLSLLGLLRGEGNIWRPLREDTSLDDIDEFAWTGPNVLRWRSRLPADPPFAATVIPYQLRYSLGGILLQDGDRYVLDHDFLFPERDGTVETFELHLTLDPAWQAEDRVQEIYRAERIPPGRSFVLKIPLRFVGAGTPHALDTSRPPEIVRAVQIMLGVAAGVVLWLFLREWRRGRFAALPVVESEAWLKQHVLAHPAEVVGAAWDDGVGSAEVVALIARLVAEGKLWSKVGSGSSMELHLETDREAFTGYERQLVDKLFFDNRKTTSTGAVKQHYRKQGFDPAAEIREGVVKRVDELLPTAQTWLFGMSVGVLTLAVIVLLVMDWWNDGPLGIASIFLLIPSLIIMAIAAGVGNAFRSRLHWGPLAFIWSLVPGAVTIATATWLLWSYVGAGYFAMSPVLVAATTAMALAIFLANAGAMRSRQSAEGVAFRKRLTAARAFFAEQLQLERPALQDDWFPWLLAFDLGKQMDDWSVQHASSGVSSSYSSPVRSSASSYSSTSSDVGSYGWTGFAGGRSGGAGASASWAAAAGSIAATVTPPSSGGSSSGGGGGSSSGGSSGGGGGGGW